MKRRRQKIYINGFTLMRLQYCFCCVRKEHDSSIENILEGLEKTHEISEISKNIRLTSHLIYLLMNDLERKSLFLPSLNIEREEGYDDDDEGEVDEMNIFEEEDLLSNLDLNKKIQNKLAKTYISSHI